MHRKIADLEMKWLSPDVPVAVAQMQAEFKEKVAEITGVTDVSLGMRRQHSDAEIYKRVNDLQNLYAAMISRIIAPAVMKIYLTENPSDTDGVGLSDGQK